MRRRVLIALSGVGLVTPVHGVEVTISFTPGGGAAFDFNANGTIDATVSSCTDASLILCH
jgi:hypothetical protein